MSVSILDLPRRRAQGGRPGITSVCSAHPLVIEASLAQARDDGVDALIEATCNQVNQDGGYTGLTPAAFRDAVLRIADAVGLPHERVILGGDHLGPNPWRHLPAEQAFGKAAALVDAYVAAGFTKLHLDTSMGCAGEPAALADAETAERAARLAGVAERVAGDRRGTLAYVLGTEVPVPGGATHALHHLDVTSPAAALRSLDEHRAAFERQGLAQAFGRAVGLVVQPGVEFGNDNVVRFDPYRARPLSQALESVPTVVFEAHSTDYQTAEALSAMVDQGFAILKVGPALTFGLREALYGLDAIADVLDPQPELRQLPSAMEQLMLEEPADWQRYTAGNPDQQRLHRHFSYSDRIRYYWPRPAAQGAVGHLMQRLGRKPIPESLVSQYLAPLYPAVASGEVSPAEPRALLVAAVRGALRPYGLACR